MATPYLEFMRDFPPSRRGDARLIEYLDREYRNEIGVDHSYRLDKNIQRIIKSPKTPIVMRRTFYLCNLKNKYEGHMQSVFNHFRSAKRIYMDDIKKCYERELALRLPFVYIAWLCEEPYEMDDGEVFEGSVSLKTIGEIFDLLSAIKMNIVAEESMFLNKNGRDIIMKDKFIDFMKCHLEKS